MILVVFTLLFFALFMAYIIIYKFVFIIIYNVHTNCTFVLYLLINTRTKFLNILYNYKLIIIFRYFND